MHILVLPLPVQGHLNPCLSLARLLVPHGFTFTFVLAGELATKLSPKEEGGAGGGEGGAEGSRSSREPSIQYAAIPTTSTSCSRIAFSFGDTLEMINDIRPAFETLLRELVSSPGGVSCIIADCFVTWSQQVASEFKIPAFAFYTTNAHTFTAMLHTHVLMSKGLVPVKDPDRMVDCIPGLPPLQVGDLPQSIRMHPSFCLDLAKDVEKAAGVIFNTVYELEKEPFEVIKSKVPMYSVGPFQFMLGLEKSGGSGTVGLWVEERECLKWLDTRPTSSVLFVAFGSLATVGRDHMKELGEGLEASGQAFLWVIRSNSINESLSDLLPEGFMERTKERGLIISWAPQLEVLSHQAVGGFLTHCGWNSLTENLSLGCVPMICWPQLAEQRINKKLLVDEWKVGLELENEDGVVNRAAVEKAVTQLMQGEVGRELRKRAMELKGIISLAVQEGGSSQNYLKALVQEIRKLGATT